MQVWRGTLVRGTMASKRRRGASSTDADTEVCSAGVNKFGQTKVSSLATRGEAGSSPATELCPCSPAHRAPKIPLSPVARLLINPLTPARGRLESKSKYVRVSEAHAGRPESVCLWWLATHDHRCCEPLPARRAQQDLGMLRRPGHDHDHDKHRLPRQANPQQARQGGDCLDHSHEGHPPCGWLGVEAGLDESSDGELEIVPAE
jgi:hypothetical protein